MKKNFNLLTIIFMFLLLLTSCALPPEKFAEQTNAAQTAKVVSWTATPTKPEIATNTPMVTPTTMPTSTPTPMPTPGYPVLANTPLPPYSGIIAEDNLDDLIVMAEIGKGSVGDLTYLPDGSALAIHTTKGVYLYDSETYEEINYLTTESSHITANILAVSPDGTHLAGSYQSNSIIDIWSIDQTSPKTELEIDSEECEFVEMFEFTPENDLILACVSSEQSTSQIQNWDTESGQMQASFEIPFDLSYGGMSISPTGKLLALAESYGNIELWDLSSGERILIYSYKTDGIRYPSVSFIEDGGALSVISGKQVFVLSTELDSLIYSANQGFHTDIWYKGEKNILLVENEAQHTLQVLTLPLEEEITFFKNFDEGIGTFSLRPDQSHLAILHGGITVFNTSNGEKVITLNEFFGISRDLTFSLDNSILAASSSTSHATHFYQTSNASLTKVYQGNNSTCDLVFINDNSEVLRIGFNDITEIDLDSWKVEDILKDTYLYPSALSIDNQILYYADSEGRIYKYNLKDRYSQRLATVDALDPEMMVISEKGRLLAISYIDYQNPQAKQPILIFEISETGLDQIGKVEIERWIYDLEFSPDGRYLLISVNETLYVWDVEIGELIFEDEWGRASNIAFDPSGLFLATSGEDYLRFWSFESDEIILLHEIPLPNTFTLAFSDDGTMLAASGPGKLYLLGNKDW